MQRILTNRLDELVELCSVLAPQVNRDDAVHIALVVVHGRQVGVQVESYCFTCSSKTWGLGPAGEMSNIINIANKPERCLPGMMTGCTSRCIIPILPVLALLSTLREYDVPGLRTIMHSIGMMRQLSHTFTI